jgi:UPF0176 protein
MENTPTYYILAYYHFVSIEDPAEEVRNHKDFFKERDAKCRIYISEEGINGQLSAIQSDAEAYMEWLSNRPSFTGVVFKIHRHHEQVFPRLTIKYRKQLVALDRSVDLSKRGEHVSPADWKKMLEEPEKHLVLDVRNDYEWRVGRFEGAEVPPCENFREFESYVDHLKEKIDPESQKVMMYCTGGIRCELFSAILKEKGFDKVYQLEGGIINYGLKVGSDHWLGKLFVFDDRLSIPISPEPSSPIGTCHLCNTTAETYYNCANMDCNLLFLCCPECLLALKGCCKEECCQSPRLRPHHPQNLHKPFRRRHHYKVNS